MDLLLTGATGLIGHSLTRRLSSTHRIWVLTHRPLLPDLFPGVLPIEQDLAVRLDYARLPKKIDAVVHLAQSRHFREFPDLMEDIFAVNTYSTLRLAEYARKAGANCFVLASTGGVYAPKKGKLVETDRITPSNFYASTKYAAELLVSNYSSFMRITFLRFFFVYGPRQRNMLIPNLVNRTKLGLPIVIEGNPGMRINPIYVDDATGVFSPILENRIHGVFNIAGDEILSITELVNLMAEISGKPANISYVDANHASDLVADNTKMKEVLGVHPQISLRQGVSEMHDLI